MTPSIFRFYYHLWSVHPLVVFPNTIWYHHQLDTVVDSPSSVDLSEFIRVTPFLGPVSGSGIDMWANLANQMWRNILRAIPGKPQEERISFCSTGCYHDWMGRLEVPQPSYSNTSLRMPMTQDGRAEKQGEPGLGDSESTPPKAIVPPAFLVCDIPAVLIA